MDDTSFNLDDFGDDDFSALFEDDDIEFRKPKKSGKREVAEAVAGSIVGGFADTINDRDFQREIIKNGLPKGYDVAYDSVLTLKDGISGVTSDISKEYNKTKNAVKKSVRAVLPKVKASLPKSLGDRLENWAGTEKKKMFPQYNEEEYHTKSIMSDVFGDLDQRAEQEATRQVSDMVDKKINLSSNKSLEVIARYVLRKDSYDQNVGEKLERKKLEIQSRQLYVLGQVRDGLTKLFEMSDSRLTDITKNTELPDFLKEYHSETAQKIMRRNFYGKVTEGANNRLGSIVDNVRKKIGSFAQSTSDSFIQTLGMAEQMGGMALDMQEQQRMMDEMEAMDNLGREMTPEERERYDKLQKIKAMGGMAGNMAGGQLGQWAGGKVTKFLKDNLGDDNLVKTRGKALSNMLQNPQKYFQHMLKNSSDMSIIGPMVDILGLGSLEDKKQNPLLQRSQVDDLTTIQKWDLKSKKSLEVVIPGYLSMMLQQITMLRTGGNVDRVTYAWDRDVFETRKSAADRLMRKILGDDMSQAAGDAVKETYEAFDDKGELSGDTKDEVLKYIVDQSRTSTGSFDIRQLIGDKSPLSAAAKAEVAAMAKTKWNMQSGDGKVDVGDPSYGGLFDLNPDNWRLNILQRDQWKVGERIKHNAKKLVNNSTLDLIRGDFAGNADAQDATSNINNRMRSLRWSLGEEFRTALDAAKMDDLEGLIDTGLVKENPNRPGEWILNMDMINQNVVDRAKTPTPTPPTPPTPPSGSGTPPVYHSGGIVGEPNNDDIEDAAGDNTPLGNIKKRLSGLKGKIPEGLKNLKLGPNEILSVLKIGEEVITEDDPRHQKFLPSSMSVDKLKEMGKQIGDKAGEAIRNYLPDQESIEELRERSKKLKDDVVDKGSSIKDNIGDKIEGMKDPLMNFVGGIHEKLNDTLAGYKDAIKQQTEKLDELIDSINIGMLGDKFQNLKMAMAGQRIKKRSMVKKLLSASVSTTKAFWNGQRKWGSFAIGKTVDAGKAGIGITKQGIGKLTTKQKALSSAKDEAADVYVPGKEDPVLQKSKMYAGDYKDQKTGKVIETPSMIKGPVIDETGSVVLNHDDLKAGPFVLGKSGITKILGGLKGLIGRGWKVSSIPFKLMGKMFSTVRKTGAFISSIFSMLKGDIYVLGETEPRILSSIWNNGGYFDSKGRVVTKLKQLVFGVYDATAKQVLSPSDLMKGLVYQDGSEVKIDGKGLKGFIRGSIGLIGKGIAATSKFTLGAFKLMGKVIKGTLSIPFRNNEDSSMKSVQYLDQIYKLLEDRLPAKQQAIREGSVQDKLLEEAAKDAAARSQGDGNDTGKPDTKGGLGVGGMILGALSGLVGKFASFKTESLKYLKTMAMAKAAASAADGLGGGGDSGGDENRRGNRNRRRSKWKDRLKGMKGKGGLLGAAAVGAGAGAYALSGDDSSGEGEGEDGSWVDTALSVGGWTLGSMAIQSLLTGGVVATAGSALLTGAGAVLAGIGSVISAPVVIGAAAVGLAAYGAYRLYKYVKNKDNHLLNFRMAQYGIDVDDSDKCSTILTLEGMLKSATIVKDGKAVLGNGVKSKDVLKLFGVDPNNKERLTDFLMWFNLRFKPIFLGWMTVTKKNDGKMISLEDLDKTIDPSNKAAIMQSAHIAGDQAKHPYSVNNSPWGGKLSVGKASVDQIYKNTYPDLEKISKNAEQKQRSRSEAKLDTSGKKPDDKPKEPVYNESVGDRIARFLTDNKRAVSVVLPGVGYVATKAAEMYQQSSGSKVTQGEMIKNVPKNVEGHEKALVKAAIKYGITDPNEIKMFLAQCAHETQFYKWLKELGNDDYFKKYNGRKDLGNTQPGDGPRFKGRGYIQLTGRYNYEAFAKASGLDVINNPDMISNDASIAAEASAFWWTKIRPQVRKYAQRGDVKGTTKMVNGGFNGLDDRVKKYQHYLAKFGSKSPAEMLGAETPVTAAVPPKAKDSTAPTGAVGSGVLRSSANTANVFDSSKPGSTASPVGNTDMMGSIGTGSAAVGSGVLMANPKGAPWMTVALGEIGVNEGNNPSRISEYHKSIGMKAGASTAWCASFVNWCLTKVGLKGSGSASARSFVKYGSPVPLSQAIPYGAVVVVKVGDTASGSHVCFATGESGGRVQVVGGNQGGAKQSGGGVTKSSFPKGSVIWAGMPTGNAKAAAATPPAAVSPPVKQPNPKQPAIPTAVGDTGSSKQDKDTPSPTPENKTAVATKASPTANMETAAAITSQSIAKPQTPVEKATTDAVKDQTSKVENVKREQMLSDAAGSKMIELQTRQLEETVKIRSGVESIHSIVKSFFDTYKSGESGNPQTPAKNTTTQKEPQEPSRVFDRPAPVDFSQ